MHNPANWIDPLGLAGCNAQFNSRKDALRAAKRDVGIPKNQRPNKVFNQKHQNTKEYDQVMLTDRNGKPILNSNKEPIWTREYHFTKSDGTKVVIQDHAAGHNFGQGGVGDQGPHFNVRPHDNIRTGSVDGTLDHYSY
ncbi:HNH/endonuclease VII fold putative polymorphic toxin [Photorhabdus laumondii]|uniref:HNH/endonuclease VII fold putative polymorphic toxin n=1 Tax=Photorhabdus laumondii TaxID=2218628 RepID=UPI0033154C49